MISGLPLKLEIGVGFPTPEVEGLARHFHQPQHQARLKRMREATVAELRRTKPRFVDRMLSVREAAKRG